MDSLDIVCPYIERDKERFYILWESLQKFCKIKNYRLFLVSPSKSRPIKSEKIIPIKETDLVKEFDDPKYNRVGWWKQQLIKLLSHKICSTEPILILDCDCFLNKNFYYSDIVSQNKIKLNINHGESWNNWYYGTQNILKIPFDLKRNDRVGVTPFVFSRSILKCIDNYLNLLYSKSKYKVLLDNIKFAGMDGATWTEYCLYHIYSDYTGIIDKYHLMDNNFNIAGNCCWLPEQSDSWDPKPSFDSNCNHFFTVFQSTANKPASWVYDKIKDYLK